jgi:hypothetical protein
MINKNVFEDEIISGMRIELRKQASDDKHPSLATAAECLHAALEILEGAGLQSRADDVLRLLQKIAQSNKLKPVEKLPTINHLMQAGLTQRDMQELGKGNPVAKAKFNLTLRGMGMSEHQIGRLIGPGNVMSEKDAKSIIDPNRSFGKIWDWMKDPKEPTQEETGKSLEFQSLSPKKELSPGSSLQFNSLATDHHTKKLTPEKQVKNLKHHGHPMNLADDNFSFDLPARKKTLSKDDMDSEFADILDAPSFDIDASDDEIMGAYDKDDSLEVFDKDVPLTDFEEERD